MECAVAGVGGHADLSVFHNRYLWAVWLQASGLSLWAPLLLICERNRPHADLRPGCGFSELPYASEVSGSANVWYYFLQTGNKNPNELPTAGRWLSVSLGESNSGTCLPLLDLPLTRGPFKPQFPHLLSRAINIHSLVLTIKWHIAQALFFKRF